MSKRLFLFGEFNIYDLTWFVSCYKPLSNEFKDTLILASLILFSGISMKNVHWNDNKCKIIFIKWYLLKKIPIILNLLEINIMA